MQPLDFRDFCPQCGGEIDRTRPYAVKRIYCSLKCKEAFMQKLLKDGRLEDKANRPPCPQCGTPIPQADTGQRIYCSDACKTGAYRARNSSNVHTCETCGVEFTGIRGRRCCSRRCAGRKGALRA